MPPSSVQGLRGGSTLPAERGELRLHVVVDARLAGAELGAALPRQPRLGIPHAWVERRGPPDVAPRRRIHGALEEAVIDEALQREVWEMLWEARE